MTSTIGLQVNLAKKQSLCIGASIFHFHHWRRHIMVCLCCPPPTWYVKTNFMHRQNYSPLNFHRTIFCSRSAPTGCDNSESANDGVLDDNTSSNETTDDAVTSTHTIQEEPVNRGGSAFGSTHNVPKEPEEDKIVQHGTFDVSAETYEPGSTLSISIWYPMCYYW